MKIRQKNKLVNKYIPLALILLFTILTITQIIQSSSTEINVKENYIGLFKLGLIPNAYSRQPLLNDIDTGVRISSGEQEFALIKSNNLQTLDYGKVFAIRIK